MHTIVLTILIIASLALILFVLLQPSKSEGLSGAITGGAEQLFGKQKARGIEAVLNRITIFLSVVFFVCAFILGYFVQ
ncbi:preprotein translocase subunit SecG [Terrilactibacillus laevilacticus]|uniref:Protein-export membrane protein SecG n=1 Tax=Terrilactibacillus laevilacticus TaxID=1380157 RepID=A0ABW5PSC1_9BACI|nr:preprotein translocase subunit SecG [Terrilactibacillus laevilacticus]